MIAARSGPRRITRVRGAGPRDVRRGEIGTATQTVGILLILTAFSRGCAALTGVEAISDGVPAFQPPEWKNARATLTWMIVILAVTFAGITFLANQFGIVPRRAGSSPRLRDGRLADRQHDLRRRYTCLLLHPVRDAGDPDPGREYRLLRLPAPLLLPGARPLPAEPVHLPRRSACLLDRHRDAGHPLLADAGRLRRRDDAHDPALRRRRLHRVHPLPGRHGRCAGCACGSRVGRAGWRSTSSAW